MRLLRHHRVLDALLAAIVVVGLAACDTLDSLLDIEDESRVIAKDLERPSQANVLVASVVNDFNCAFALYVTVGGLIGDEFDTATNLLGMIEYDRRSVQPNDRGYSTRTCDDIGSDSPGLYMPLSTARWMADYALDLLRSESHAQVPGRTGLIATAAAYSGYSHLLIGEGMCSAAFDGGPEASRAEVFERAEERFSTAIASAEEAGDQGLLNMARVGRARARLNLGLAQEAARDAEVVPVAFRWDAVYASTPVRNQNAVYFFNSALTSVTVGPLYREVSFQGIPDPRVPVVDLEETAPDQSTPIFVQIKYPAASSSIPIATWEEAQLIVAEARGGSEAVDIISVLHDRVGLPPFTDTDPEAIRQHLIRERRMELFAESHHLGDLIRLDLPLTPPAGTPYPAGGEYGEQRCLPLPDVERVSSPNTD